ncbi:hypothetical protein [Arsenicicoccus sp. oral taxon 190]|uniref:hypothetical protein n=1 Tax=Arsenicicoccus sp. oral taxon 190 TaxID=1658671 RepID=UPI00067DFD76|nr:hypothetical protein [Arsenicicoccus sp. oral taxon 190]
MALGHVARTFARVAGATAGVAAGAALTAGIVRRLGAAGGASGPRLRRSDLPDWVLPTDVLASYDEADEQRGVSDELGLPLVLDEVDAWAALGAVAALERLVDDGTRSSVVLDLGARRSALSRWSRARGFRVVREAPPERGAVDLVTRLHPDGAVAGDVDAVLELAATVLRPGGAVVVTVPVGGLEAPGAMGRADLRALEARAHDLGLVLVGDLDGEVGRRLAAAVQGACDDEGRRAEGSAFALARLTLRRR